ncbi:hypothetical protein NA57DRAFT_51965 [Rhizodiscina lignyota]|uniref:Uncharacterized protein n=1 Tax=Rhizodiscina lignyota TaxID=1504668 RepID=A0A9P4INA8_9PEZI|nr:hypothetical protein NA57DRAFT_51965 [Rhizodiscina lignyota]
MAWLGQTVSEGGNVEVCNPMHGTDVHGQTTMDKERGLGGDGPTGVDNASAKSDVNATGNATGDIMYMNDFTSSNDFSFTNDFSTPNDFSSANNISHTDIFYAVDTVKYANNVLDTSLIHHDQPFTELHLSDFRTARRRDHSVVEARDFPLREDIEFDAKELLSPSGLMSGALSLSDQRSALAFGQQPPLSTPQQMEIMIG